MNEVEAKRVIEKTLSYPFLEDNFNGLSLEIFNDMKIVNRTINLKEEKFLKVKKLKIFGKFIDDDGEEILVCTSELKNYKSIDKNLSLQRDVAKEVMNRENVRNVFFAFYSENSDDWRLSFIEKVQFTEIKNKKINIKVSFSDLKRYTYLVGKNEPNFTAKSQLIPLIASNQKNNINDIINAFNVEKITKQFYEDYRKLFENLSDELILIIEKDIRIKNEFNNKNINVDTFAKKTLGQIVFLYFLQKKGWLGISKNSSKEFNKWGSGPKNFVEVIYNDFISKNKKDDSFFNDILEPLFYDALNTERDNNYYEKLNCKIPFLNGGLFEPINDYDWITTNIKISNTLIFKIIETFNRYNFTVKEDEPLEKEVAVDPEMLGKVFENLLPENLRKGKGSYYTPREIVQFMCRETLSNYLSNKILNKLSSEEIILLFDIDPNDNNNIIKLKKYENVFKVIIIFLDEITICDPAVGSGAFPLTIMQEIIHIKKLIYFVLEKNYDPYRLKRRFIEKNLFCVDIDQGAIEISKLRLWLSLIVDETNFDNIKPLPNLDFKIIQGNSLIQEIGGIDFSKEKFELFSDMLDQDVDLSELFNKYYNTTSKSEKKDIKNQINEKLKNIIFKQLKNTSDKDRKKILEEAIINLPNNNNNFFLWKIYFEKIFIAKRGFDLIISNPPYIFSRSSKEKGLSEIDKKYYKKTYSVIDYKINTYILFVELASKLLNNDGFLSYIIPNNWMTINTNLSLRKLVLEKDNIIVVNFLTKVFESAGVDNSVLIFKNEKNSNAQIRLIEHVGYFNEIDKLETSIFKHDEYIINFEQVKNKDCYKIFQIIEKNSITLLNNAVPRQGLIAYGVGGGKPTQTKKMKDKKIYHSERKVDDTYYKYLESNDIHRYKLNWSKKYLKYGDNLFRKREFNLYNQNRILVKQIPNKPPYCISATFTDLIYLNDVNSIIIKDIIKFEPLTLLGILNSKLISFWFIFKFGKFQRKTFPQFKINELAKFPVPKKDISKEEEIISYVKEKLKNPEINEIDEKIDKLVFKMFDIDKPSILSIDNFLKKMSN